MTERLIFTVAMAIAAAAAGGYRGVGDPRWKSWAAICAVLAVIAAVQA